MKYEDRDAGKTIRVSVDVDRQTWELYRELATRNHRSVAGQLRADLQSIVDVEFQDRKSTAERQEGL